MIAVAVRIHILMDFFFFIDNCYKCRLEIAYIEFQGNRDYTRGFISENFGRRGGRGRTSMEQRIPNRDELDEQLDEFMQNQNN